MEKTKTAVEWLEGEFLKLESTIGVHGVMYEIIEKAKGMEKSQIVEACFAGMESHPFDPNMGRAEMYYDEKYSKNENK